MNVSSSTYPAVVCLSPSIGSSQADPKLSLKGHGPYAAEANCDVDHYLTNCVHRGCTDALRLSFYSGARSRILFSVTAPFNPAAAMCPPSAIRLRWASSQWRPSKNRVGLRLGPSTSSRQRELTVIRSGWERGT